MLTPRQAEVLKRMARGCDPHAAINDMNGAFWFQNGNRVLSALEKKGLIRLDPEDGEYLTLDGWRAVA